ncbi:MAG: hypothetical protein RL553_1766, partial [Planctomycetota bacterium]
MPLKSVQDVVCGMMVNPDNAAATKAYDNATYYFCHASCAKKFELNPESYLKNDLKIIKNKPMVSTGGNLRYSCPMDPEI